MVLRNSGADVMRRRLGHTLPDDPWKGGENRPSAPAKPSRRGGGFLCLTGREGLDRNVDREIRIVARSTPRAGVRCGWCIRKRSGLRGSWRSSTW
jgi:hypothetical protein